MSDLSDCVRVLEELLREPGTAQRSWTRLAGQNLLLNALSAGVTESPSAAAGEQMSRIQALIEDSRLEGSLEIALAQQDRSITGAIRLTRHAKALVSTAMVARAARIVVTGDTGQKTALEANLEKSLSLLAGNPKPASRCRPPVFGHGAPTPGGEIQRMLRARSAGRAQIAALYWSLYWVDRASPGSPSLPVLLRRQQPVWLVATGNNGGALHQMTLELLAEDAIAQLFEHPESALLPFGEQLLDAVVRAWDRIGTPPALCWRLPDKGTQLEGDSLGGAVALAIRALADDSNYRSDFIALARLSEDSSSDALEPVGGLRQKLAVLDPKQVRLVLLGAGDAQDPVASRGRIPLSDSEWESYTSSGLQLRPAGNVEEGVRIARGWDDQEESLTLGGYEKIRRIPADTAGQTWQVAKNDQRWLLKQWPYHLPDEEIVWRASWDRELRTLYRVCTSARAEKSLITLKDAFVDREQKSFVMVFGAEGYETLDALLRDRSRCRWLRPDTLAMDDAREPVWRALRTLASGIALLHSQRIMHRNVCAERVYLDPGRGPGTMRLGGFEWSVRLGSQFNREEVRGWAVPPECERDARYTLDMDWYGFGMLAARCFYTLESLQKLPPADLNRAVNDVIQQDNSLLTAKERNFMRGFLEREPEDRLRNVDDIIPALDEIVSSLTAGVTPDDKKAPLCIIFNHRNGEFQRQLENYEFVPDPDDQFMPFMQEQSVHRANLVQFMQKEFVKPVLYATGSGVETRYHLAGRRMTLELVSDGWEDPPTWEFAAVRYVGPFSVPREAKSRRIEGPEVVFLLAGDQKNYYNHQNWKPFHPVVDVEPDLTSQSIVRFQRFLRYTNQLELLMRYAEIFPCRIEPEGNSPGMWRIKVTERSEPERVPPFCVGEGGMAEFFQNEKDKGSATALITTSDEMLPDTSDLPWTVEKVQLRNEEYPQAFVVLSRTSSGTGTPPRGDFYVRASGYSGQVKLVERRRRAIDRLEDHTYLLKALVYPGAVWMDTRQQKLNYEPDEGQVDGFKQAVMKDILRSRPIYALQGPPGTGKTTLVAHLLREILKDDPSAQILVTAQAHGAVDVLRQKVNEAFSTVDFDDQPVTVRLGSKVATSPDEASEVEQEAQRLLVAMRGKFEHEPKNDIQRRWTQLLDQMVAPGREGKAEETFHAFVQLIRMGANIIYCTTSAGDLEEIVDENLSFDWAVLEEAGKIHGFDLALPMQAGHRWLLVGDQEQLHPYRIKDFEFGIGRDFDAAAACISRLSRKERDLVDSDWREAWSQMNPPNEPPPAELGKFKDYSKSWLSTFDRIYKFLKNVTSDGKVTEGTDSVGAAVGRLTRQYRMHPTIGDLISQTFYERKLHSETKDEAGPLRRVQHCLASPSVIKNKALVWIDTQWCRTHPTGRGEELGPPHYNRYSNREEAQVISTFLGQMAFTAPPERPLSIALLSPYSKQVAELNSLKQGLPAGLVWRESIYTRRGGDRPEGRLAHTVDSFQGNQASIVIVSLVRNNNLPKINGLGFLREVKRMNVLLSRAECLLVLVGSWDFFTYQLSGFSAENQEHLTFQALRTAFEVIEQMFIDERAVHIRLNGGRFEKIEHTAGAHA